MGSSLYKKEKSEVGTDELLAYTFAKIHPYEWVRITMYVEDDLYGHPPIFCWRFANADLEIYRKIEKCVDEFVGNMEWVAYKGNGLNQSGRNYAIEPKLFFELREKFGTEKLPDVLKNQYPQECLRAIRDIELLCEHIEQYFNIKDAKPHLPVLPTTKK